jgi:hypothetical protein
MMSKSELDHELHMYHCAGGHTRAAQAKAALLAAGFKFESNSIFWPDNVMVSFNDEGNIVYRDWTRQGVR